MARVFVIRAYGDFVIMLRCLLLSEYKQAYTLIVSEHLRPLYTAIEKVINTTSLNVEFHDFGIKKAQLSLFTNKHLLSQNTFNEVAKIKTFLQSSSNNKEVDYLEQNKRKFLFELLTAHKFKSIFNTNLIYDAYSLFFKSLNEEIDYKPENIKNVLIFPDSRLLKKNIPNALLLQLKERLILRGYQCTVALFMQKENADDKVYENFDDLLQFIQCADYIIGADSLPIHIAQLLNKPHYILYSPSLTKNFITPFAKNSKSFGNFRNYTIPLINEQC
jgi:ADP-heptose:LPS heptosyltransferase